jgi:hypothetical protein
MMISGATSTHAKFLLKRWHQYQSIKFVRKPGNIFRTVPEERLKLLTEEDFHIYGNTNKEQN